MSSSANSGNLKGPGNESHSISFLRHCRGPAFFAGLGAARAREAEENRGRRVCDRREGAAARNVLAPNPAGYGTGGLCFPCVARARTTGTARTKGAPRDCPFLSVFPTGGFSKAIAAGAGYLRAVSRSRSGAGV